MSIQGNKTNSALALMGTSLFLLLIFLGNWLNNTYVAEKNTLIKDLNYVVHDVTRSVQNTLIQDVLINNSNNLQFKSSNNGKSYFQKIIKKDSIKISYEEINSSEQIIGMDTSIRIHIEAVSDTNMNIEGDGLLAMLINWQPSSNAFITSSEEDHTAAIDLISKNFSKAIAKTNLPKIYFILKQDSVKGRPDITIDLYKTSIKHYTHVVYFPKYQGYLIKKLIPSLIFALLLLIAIILSFYVIYSNWKKQEQLIAIKNDFVSNMTHELKTPISTVSVALEALSNFDVVKDKIKTLEYLEISKNEMVRLRILVDKVLKMSMLEKGESNFSSETVDFSKLVDEVLISMKVQFDKSGASVNKEIHGDNFQVEIDKIHMTNMVYNLLDNAIKYCINSPIILVSLFEKKDQIVMSIEDNGMGIKEEYQSKIFDRFFRIPSGNKHEVKGHGLGLSYVASVIRHHHGSIKVTSKLKVGSKFQIHINKQYEHQ